MKNTTGNMKIKLERGYGSILFLLISIKMKLSFNYGKYKEENLYKWEQSALFWELLIAFELINL